MKITVRYYAILREITGRESEELDVPEDCDGETLMALLIERHSRLKAVDSSIRLATDTEYIDRDTRLARHRHVSLIPPVSGG